MPNHFHPIVLALLILGCRAAPPHREASAPAEAPTRVKSADSTPPANISHGAIFEVRLREPGDYPFVTHAFADASKGAIGALRAGPPSGPPMKTH